MASEIRFTPETDATILMNLPAAGKYWVFLAKDHGDFFYKVDSAGNITSATNALVNPMSANGDLIYGGIAGVATRLAAGSNGQVLTLAAGIPSWATPTTGTVTSVSGTANRITSTGGATPVIDISASYVGQTSLTTLGTIGTGTWQGTAVGAQYGGTGQTVYAVGDLLYASTTTALSKLADVAAGSYLRSGGVSTAPAWSTTTLPNSATTGDLLYASASNVYSNIAGVTTGNALISGGVATAPSWGKIGLTTHVSGVLPIANGGTNASTASITSFNNITGYTAAGATGTTSTNLVFSTSPTITTPTVNTSLNLNYATASTVVYSDASKNLISLANGAGVLTNNGTGTLTWAASSSGITINSTAITSGTATRVLFENGSNQVSEDADFTWDSTNNVLNTTSGYNIAGVAFARTIGASPSNNIYIGEIAGNTTTTPLRNIAIGYGALNSIANTGNDNVAVGYASMLSSTTGSGNAGLGRQALYYLVSGSDNSAIGRYAGIGDGAGGIVGTFQSGSYCTFLGGITGGANVSSSIAIGYNAFFTAANQCVIGSDSGNGIVSNVYFNGVNNSSAQSIIINACGGSGSNNAGASMTFATRSTGSATPPNIIFQTGTTLGSGTTLQTPATRLTIGELRVTAAVPIKLMGYTVATLPTGSVGDLAYATDLLAPTFLTAAVGGGAVVGLVFYNGSTWVTP